MKQPALQSFLHHEDAFTWEEATFSTWRYCQSKRYCPVLVAQKRGCQCIPPQGGAFLRYQNRTIPFGLIVPSSMEMSFMNGARKRHLRQGGCNLIFILTWRGCQHLPASQGGTASGGNSNPREASLPSSSDPPNQYLHRIHSCPIVSQQSGQ